ncbi:hypothetical protein ATSB10_32560 [Dyella thiooxydans]|uniref:Uncharacterized protein n=1 Tax=Dyella thiooxydans TaxID=445710 RepID=A0A160N482_9GAMM|nr:hypothetical protein ATSB10_32560 [Dyella thiooxydans]
MGPVPAKVDIPRTAIAGGCCTAAILQAAWRWASPVPSGGTASFFCRIPLRLLSSGDPALTGAMIEAVCIHRARVDVPPQVFPPPQGRTVWPVCRGHRTPGAGGVPGESWLGNAPLQVHASIDGWSHQPRSPSTSASAWPTASPCSGCR